MKKSFLKGLFDTEGSMVFKKRYREKHYYPTISIGSQSKNLIKVFLDEIGIKSCASYDVDCFRNWKNCKRNVVDIYGENNMNLLFGKIGFDSSKHLTKYKIWNKFGFCLPYTDILERKKILKWEININSYY